MSQHGYTSYRPTGRAKSVLEAARYILIQYKAWDSPLTVRQVFYRLVAEYGYDKTESAYGSLVNYIARSRRAYQREKLEAIADGLRGEEATKRALSNHTLIPFSWIRDEKGKTRQEQSYDDRDDFLKTIKAAAENMKLDRMKGQEFQIELWCEAAGMVGLMAEIAEPYGIRVSSGGGYDSVTAKHRLAQRALDESIENERKLVVLHIGDFDPSGEGMFETLDLDVGQMVYDYGVGENIMFRRIALTERQVIDWNVETAPPKTLDSRRRAFLRNHPEIRDHLGSDHITAQLEALKPNEIKPLVTEAIDEYVDIDLWNDQVTLEEKVREDLLERLGIE